MGVMINSAMTNSEWYTYNSLCHHGTCMLKASPACLLECTAELRGIIQTTSRSGRYSTPCRYLVRLLAPTQLKTTDLTEPALQAVIAGLVYTEQDLAISDWRLFLGHDRSSQAKSRPMPAVGLTGCFLPLTGNQHTHSTHPAQLRGLSQYATVHWLWKKSKKNTRVNFLS